jgi:hypothetical protein
LDVVWSVKDWEINIALRQPFSITKRNQYNNWQELSEERMIADHYMSGGVV